MEEDRRDVAEFNSLRAHYEAIVGRATAAASASAAAASGASATANPATASFAGSLASSSVADLFRSSAISLPPSLLANIPSLASLNKSSLPLQSAFNANSNLSDPNNPNNPNPQKDYISKFKFSSVKEMDLLEDMINLNLDDATSLSQRFRQLDDQPRFQKSILPQRILLRTKKTKRCKDCNNVLVKPEQKAQLAKFSIKRFAIDNIPNITIAHPAPIVEPGQTATILLKFTNPQPFPMQVMLASLPALNGDETDEAVDSMITVIAPLFVLEGFNELVDFDDDKIRSVKPKLEVGVVEKKNNWAIVSLDVAVGMNFDRASRLEFPLLVKYSVAQHGPRVPLPGKETKTVSFWAVVSLKKMRTRIFERYARFMMRYPLGSQCLVAGALWSAGDILSQKITANHKDNKLHAIDWKRVAIMTSYGFFIAGPLYTFWYRSLDRTVEPLVKRALKALGRTQSLESKRQMVWNVALAKGETLPIVITFSSMKEPRS
ncbi:hypothetical protein HK100_000005 [Physocladia obscura]|uniref:Dynactin subunit 4 n=1 Tax=Physocladia obscura TaxID=109957 RepID=A0AAD5XHP8_9FUNG|nr:hypothetical protein HK100_000005 [Physocladia obscura]